jgi:perosamine synthetase
MKGSKKRYSRREFIKKNSLTGLGSVLSFGAAPILLAETVENNTPAILGGQKIRTKGWPGWPRWISETDEKPVLDVLRSGIWSRAAVVNEFEKKWAETIGAKRCLAVVNGTSALIIAIRQLDIGAGDEVLVTPYTYIATVDAILANGAMPIFVDIDPETFQMDPGKIEEKISPRTRAILPVHIAGIPADIIRIMEIAKKHDLIVIEDACQAWLAEVNHRKVGTFGHAGCYSFQNSKNIPMGEGGAIVSDDESFMDRCYSYHNFGFPYGSVIGTVSSAPVMMGIKLRLTEYQAAIGLAQLKRLEGETVIRNENAKYLNSQLRNIPGILPYKLYDNVTRVAVHLFPFRYKKDEFKGLSREDFLKALSAEGIPCTKGYTQPLNNLPYLKDTFQSKNFRKMYPPEMLDFNKYVSLNKCPNNDRIINEEAVWFEQNMFLGTIADMDDIVMAVKKIHDNADKIRQTLKK